MPGRRRELLLSLLPALSLAGVAAPAAKVRVALFDIEPYAYRHEGQPRGLYVQWLGRLLEGLGLQAEFQVLPIARVAMVLAQAEADLTLAFSSEALERVAVSVGAAAQVDAIVVSRADHALQELDALRGAALGRARGACQDLAARAELGIRWTEVNQFGSALRMLNRGRLDGVCMTRGLLRHLQRQDSELAGARFAPPLLLSRRPVLLFARAGLDPLLIERLRSAMQRQGGVVVD